MRDRKSIENQRSHLDDSSRSKQRRPTKKGDALKAEITRQLNQQIHLLGKPSSTKNIDDDDVLMTLTEIQKKAHHYDLRELTKLAKLATGKRILNVEVERRRKQFDNKREKKKKIENYFRENRIKQIDVVGKALEKLSQNTLIVEPYASGRGFIESENLYLMTVPSITSKNYTEALQDCEYLKVIKQVNNIFLQKYFHSSDQIRHSFFNSTQLRFCLALLILVLFFCFFVSGNQIGIAQILLAILTCLLVICLLGISVRSFYMQYNANFQLEETQEEVKHLFELINRENRLQGKKHRWKSTKGFLFLEIQFDQDYVFH